MKSGLSDYVYVCERKTDSYLYPILDSYCIISQLETNKFFYK